MAKKMFQLSGGSLWAAIVIALFMSSLAGIGFVGTTFGSALAAQNQNQSQNPNAALTPAQIQAIQAQVTAAINAANMQQYNSMTVDPAALAICNCANQGTRNTQIINRPNNDMACTNPARVAALAQAIADALVMAVNTYGSGAASEITSIIIATAMTAGVPATAIGSGLGKGAQLIAQGNGAAGILVAQDIANEGTADIANCFASTVGLQQLATIALGPPSTVGATGGNNPPGNNPPTPPPVVAVSSS